MSETGTVSTPRRLAAVVALLAALLSLAVVLAAAIRRMDLLLVGVGSLAASIAAAWLVLSRRGRARTLAALALVVALGLFVTVSLSRDTEQVAIVALALGAVAVAAGRYALDLHAPSGTAPVSDAAVAGQPRKPVLLMNLRSGGGKAERVDLAGRCKERGIEPIVLHPGEDLLVLAEDAIARGADVIGMAGGDGSQALVASVASRYSVPLVVVPAGTRNHFALDLGVNRDDVLGALDAYTDGVDVVIDLAEINGRAFVNNASMGVYAQVVQSPEYRGAKMRTAAELLPDVLGPAADRPDLRFALPSGEQVTTAQVLLVSNNPYQLSQPHGGGMRERLDGGVLGVVYLQVRGAADAELLAAAQAAGRLQRFRGYHEWTTLELEVESGRPVEVGVDGEALVLDPPLRFAVRPGALTVRLPRSAVARSARRPARMHSARAVAELWRVAIGRSAAAP